MIHEKALLECQGYKTLLAAVEHDEKTSSGVHDYRAKLSWVLERVKHYAAATGLDAAELLNAWERQRSYWYMNYYQDSKQPKINGTVRVFETNEETLKSIGKEGFRCPKCNGVSANPQVCSCDGCDWKSYGLFGTLGKGVYAFVKEDLTLTHFFKPIAWEAEEAKTS